jgi:hypothetical protein
MDVIGELQTHPFHDAMTIKAGIFAGTGSAAQQGDERDQQYWKLHVIRFGQCVLLDEQPGNRKFSLRSNADSSAGAILAELIEEPWPQTEGVFGSPAGKHLLDGTNLAASGWKITDAAGVKTLCPC